MTIGPDCPLSIDAIDRAARTAEPITFSDEARRLVTRASAFLDQIVAERRIVYGITTGFGPLADTWIDPSRSEELQRGLLAHLRSGVGPALPREAVRAIIVARLASLCQGHSGIRMTTLEMLARMVELGVTPRVPSMGTVGASGDLTPLAHIAGTMQGEGEVTVAGETLSAAEGLRRVGLTPIVFGPKEAIALVNGTSAMTAIAALNGADARRIIGLAVRLGLLYAEVMGARAESFDERVGRVRPHPGQLAVHRMIAEWIAPGSRLDARSSTRESLPAAGSVMADRAIVQDAYTMRCIPQLYGAALDALEYHDAVVTRELNAVSDNPLLFPEDDAVIQAGNFFGQHVAAVSDSLTATIVTVAGHIERVIDRVTDPVRSRGLPPMLQSREPGLQSGLMGAQVTATALLAEMRTRTIPAGTQSIPTNAANQDVVTMGTIAARTAAWQVERLCDLVAIEGIALAQAAEIRGLTDFSRASQATVAAIRAIVPTLEDDRPLSDDIQRLARAVARGAQLR